MCKQEGEITKDSTLLPSQFVDIAELPMNHAGTLDGLFFIAKTHL